MPTSSSLSFPVTLTNGTTADATQVMQDFNAVATLINSTGLGTNNIKDGTITGALLDSGVVDGSTLDFNGSTQVEVKDAGIVTAKLADANVTLAKLAAAVQQSLNPAGSVLAYGGASAPTGYLLCDGSAVSRTTYSALYAAIGIVFGAGNLTTTFNLPDLRGRFIRGTDDMTSAAGNDPDAASRTASNTGGNTGNTVGSLQADQFANHSHTFNGTAFTSTAATGSGVTTPQPTALTTNTNGGNETRPKNVYLNYIIKT